MPKFKVLKDFRDKHSKKVHEMGAEIEISVKRANEIEKNLGSSFLSRINEEEK